MNEIIKDKSYDINDYLKDDKELQKAVIRELFKEITTQQDKLDAYKVSENEANEIIAELQAYKDVNEDFKNAYAELKAENERLKEKNDGLKSQLDFEIQRIAVAENATEQLEDEYCKLVRDYKELQEENKRLNKLTGIFSARLCEKYRTTLQEIKEYINAQGIDNKWNMRIQRFRSEILQKITKAEEE